MKFLAECEEAMLRGVRKEINYLIGVLAIAELKPRLDHLLGETEVHAGIVLRAAERASIIACRAAFSAFSTHAATACSFS